MNSTLIRSLARGFESGSYCKVPSTRPCVKPNRFKRLLVLGVLLLSVGLSAVTLLLSPPIDLDPSREALARRDFTAARRYLSDYLDRYPDDLSALLLAAEASRREGRYLAASDFLRNYESLGGPPLPLELEQRLLRVQQGDPAEAALVHRYCLEHPDAPEILPALEALIVADLGQLSVPMSQEVPLAFDHPPPQLARVQQTTEQWLSNHLTSDDKIAGLVWRGRVRGLAGDHIGAVADLKHALSLDSSSFEARAYLALSIAQEEPRTAIEHLEMLRERHPADLRILFAVAGVRRSLGELDTARELLDRFLQFQPGNAQALIERGLVAVDDRQPAEALPFLEQAALQDPDSPDVHLALARCLRLKGDVQGVEFHQQRFLALDAGRSLQKTEPSQQSRRFDRSGN